MIDMFCNIIVIIGTALVTAYILPFLWWSNPNARA